MNSLAGLSRPAPRSFGSGSDLSRLESSPPARHGRCTMIRQAISCDICGAEKKQAKHWFVTDERDGELRIAQWNPAARVRPATRHLCGQTCLHKLIDEFMARSIAGRGSAAQESCPAAVHSGSTDTSLTSATAHEEFMSSAVLVTPHSTPVQPAPIVAASAVVIPMQPRLAVAETRMPQRVEEPQPLSFRHRRVEAWERERERGLRAVDRRPESPARSK